MNSSASDSPAIKTSRKSEMVIMASPGEPGAPIFVSITSGKHQNDYWFERIPADFGIGVRVRKVWDGKTRDFAGEVYDVNLDTISHDHSCECMGFLRWGHCRHVDAAIQLFDAGWLLPAPRPEHTPERPAKQPPALEAADIDDVLAYLHAMPRSETRTICGHTVTRLASAWRVDERLAFSPRQLAECLQQATPCETLPRAI